IGLSGPAGNLIKQARELGINSQIVSFSEIEDPNFIKVAGEAAEGMIISSAEPLMETNEITKFKEDYREMFNTEPDILAANSYDALKLQVMVYLECDGETECMREELHKIIDYNGVSGDITIQEDGSSKKNNLFKIVRDGKFVRYGNN
ncbi:ABC transporter substrate-binding protein, partial [Candidatus Pacearchaeota archaeon]|nr:ABC transporter substrate-binding protein [Candidatus Pacearchaeota archaeon]